MRPPHVSTLPYGLGRGGWVGGVRWGGVVVVVVVFTCA